jgi:hypothetical protein
MSQTKTNTARAISGARRKCDQAKFFLGKLQEMEVWSHENLSDAELQFGYYLDAFLAAARSICQVLAEAGSWNVVAEERKTWPSEEQELERALKSSRDVAVHLAKDTAESTIEYVPVSELPQRPRHPFDGHASYSRPPGVPETRRGARRFTIDVGGQNRPAVECCSTYLALMSRLVTKVEGRHPRANTATTLI